MKIPVICVTLLVEKSPQALPLGAACIASAIKNDASTRNYCDVKLRAFSPEDEDFIKHNSSVQTAGKFLADKLSEEIDFSKPVVFSFSVFMWNHQVLVECAMLLKNKGGICICGGPEVTANPDCFNKFDAVITGEGERKVPVVLAKLLSEKEVIGKRVEEVGEETSKSGDFRVSNFSSTLSELSLDDYPSPYLDGTINPAEYGGALWELARGCPFKCSYCYESKGEKSVRLFPMERLKKELELFAKLKIPQVFVLDPTYNANKQRAIEMLNLIAKITPDTFYYFEARAEFIDRQMAQAFTKIPCAVQFGLQSADENVLRLVNRPFNKKVFVKNIGILNDVGVTFGFDLIYGLPGETLRGFKDGIDFAIGLYPNNLELFCLSVLPGTDLFDRAKELNLTYEEQPPYHIIHTDKYSVEDIARAEELSTACNIFYNEGKAVPWFNTICRAVKIKPSDFFKQFYDYLKKNNLVAKGKSVNAVGNAAKKDTTDIMCKLDGKKIEELQIGFVTELFKLKHQDRLIKAAVDVIKFNGAISRTTETRKPETVQLTYNAEYVASEYATDLQFFVANVKPRPCKMQTFLNRGQVDFRVL